MTFDDQAAEAALELAKNKASELGREIHPPTAKHLKNFNYMDDGAIAGNSQEELLKMREERQEDGTYNGYLSRILETC